MNQSIYADISNAAILIDNKACIAAFLTDVTERKMKEKEKQELQEHLQRAQKMEAIGTFAGGIAHDFNNILHVIIGFAELSIEDEEDIEAIRQNLRDILHSAFRARDLIQQILAFSRKTDSSSKQFQVEPIVKEALKMLRAMLPANITICQRLYSHLSIKGDPTHIHQILMNLCINAEHAMEEHGGVLDVQLSDIELDSDFTASHPDLQPGSYVLLSVADTGSGIPHDIIHRIFDPFFTTKEQGRGTGMGLSVVHGIVGNYGGDINASSEPGKGSVFNVYLPAMATQPPEETPADVIDLAIGTERLLLVDDEPALVSMMKKTLEAVGYAASSYTSSREALDMFRSTPDAFDLVITDMTMPDISGDELAAELMKIRPDISVIVCSGFTRRMTDEKAVKMNIKAFLQKPVIREKLIQTVRKVLDEIKGDLAV